MKANRIASLVRFVSVFVLYGLNCILFRQVSGVVAAFQMHDTAASEHFERALLFVRKRLPNRPHISFLIW